MPPNLFRKIAIVAAVDGLILSPVLGKGAKTDVVGPTIKVQYRTGLIQHASLADKESDNGANERAESWGIAGLFKVSPSTAFLIAITRREQVATLERSPIYCISDISIIPLASQAEASAVLRRARLSQAASERRDSGEYSDDDDASAIGDDDIRDDASIKSVESSTGKPATKGGSSITEDVIKKKGVYGRFAEKWFSKRGWVADSQRSLGMSDSSEVRSITPEPSTDKKGNTQESPELQPNEEPVNSEDTKTVAELAGKTVEKAVDETKETVAHTLTPKLLHSTRLLLASSRSFFFAYDFDITRSLANRAAFGSHSDLPLYKRVDPLFFWNYHLIKPFEDAGFHNYVLPLMQGFIGQRTFEAQTSPPHTAPSTPEAKGEDANAEEEPVYPPAEPEPAADPEKKSFILTLISRRSIKRAGLRYLRRGVDDEGHVANCVETEQILNAEDKTFSFVQMRGSIPIYFQQSPYNLRPKPVLLHSEDSNKAAFNKHLRHIRERYGDVYAINLVEKHGNEAIVGEKYEKFAQEFNESPKGGKIGFNWFDFHHVCRGMKFENVSILLDEMASTLETYGWTESTASQPTRKQTGIIRTNCMDCLDRTNVVQSACARAALESQLNSLSIDLTKQTTEWFNILWADNGDAISKQYASTAALKGDFTRTRKRNYRGALTDLGLTMSRYFTNIISDFFTQAAIDFLLGNVTEKVFSEFEADMMSSDPAVSMKRVRQNAIEISQKIVIANDEEELIGAWTLLTPHHENSLRSFPFSEVVLLLTTSAIYSCRFDFPLEKVSAFERIDLAHISHIQYGTYITSTLASSHTDPTHNVGFLIRYTPGTDDESRVNTRSLTSMTDEDGKAAALRAAKNDDWAGEEKFIAFKALPTSSSTISRNVLGEGDSWELIDEDKVIEGIVAEIERASRRAAHARLAAGLPISSTLQAEEERAQALLHNKGKEEDKPAIEAVKEGVSQAVEGVKEGNVEKAVGAVTGDKTEMMFVVQRDLIGIEEARRSTGLLEQWGYKVRKLVWA
ncbi:hypothetical protein BJ508DRAFT_419417 [Ascobolus immersus RN42]|uniref:SacI domain protein n=1 Tax=Ascobolus immersus RN42 TaxID=1160509 RepID=A0A3N4HSC1_ASCIM|nr:hypothetical protein BJ508DRAFT_419417 [Ascobolus immersus RN42]